MESVDIQAYCRVGRDGRIDITRIFRDAIFYHQDAADYYGRDMMLPEHREAYKLTNLRLTLR